MAVSQPENAEPDLHLALLGAPLTTLLETWASGEILARPDEARLASVSSRAPGLLRAIAKLTPSDHLPSLGDALSRSDPRAGAALVALESMLIEAEKTLLARCARWRSSGEWAALLGDAGVTLEIAHAAGHDPPKAYALSMLASAYAAIGDATGLIESHSRLLTELPDSPRELRLAAHSSLGGVYVDVGRPDDALWHCERALELSTEARERRPVRAIRARALAELGELDAAVRAHHAEVDELEAELAGAADRERAATALGRALLRAADPVIALGEPEQALELLDRSRSLLQGVAGAESILLNLQRSRALSAIGQTREAGISFTTAHDEALDHSQRAIDRERYRSGLAGSRAVHAELGEARRLWRAGRRHAADGKWKLAFERLEAARRAAAEAGEHHLALRVGNYAGSLLADVGQFVAALEVANRVHHEAMERGLAGPELMALGTLARLAAEGVDVPDPLGRFGLLMRAWAVLGAHTGVLIEASTDLDTLRIETAPRGPLALYLAKLAEEHDALSLAARYYREAIEAAPNEPGTFPRANRLGGLCIVLSRDGQHEAAQRIAQELEALLVEHGLDTRTRLTAHRALGLYHRGASRPDSRRALDHLARAAALAEQLRLRTPIGRGRQNAAGGLRDVHRSLASMLEMDGRHTEAFQALQGARDRRVIDVLAAGGDDAEALGAPPTVAEVAGLLDRVTDRVPTALVDLMLEEGALTAFIVKDGTIDTVRVEGDTAALDRAERGDVRQRERRLIRLCLENELLADLAERVVGAVPADYRLLLVPDGLLQNLPLHIIPVDGTPLCEHRALGYEVAAAMLRFTGGRTAPIGSSIVAGDSAGDLPGAARECAAVADALGTKALVGSRCSFEEIASRLSGGQHDVVHLAVHGRGDVRRGGRGSLLLANASGTEWVPFERLASLPWKADLVVFSGCSTGVAGPSQGHALASVARAAAEAGAAAVVACLWPVADRAAERFMVHFHGDLARGRRRGPVDLRGAMDRARRYLRDGQDSPESASDRRRDGRDVGRGVKLRPPGSGREPNDPVDPAARAAQDWAPFVLIGDPIIGA